MKTLFMKYFHRWCQCNQWNSLSDNFWISANKVDEVEDMFDMKYIALVEEMWKEYGDKHQRPIEQIITETICMTDNSTIA